MAKQTNYVPRDQPKKRPGIHKKSYLQFPVIKELSAKVLKKSWKKRDALVKNLKDPKFRAKAKLKDYKSSI